MINYSYTHILPKVKGSDVVGWIFGVVGQDDTNKLRSAEAVDHDLDVEDHKPLSDYTQAEVMALVDQVKLDLGIEANIASQISTQASSNETIIMDTFNMSDLPAS